MAFLGLSQQCYKVKSQEIFLRLMCLVLHAGITDTGNVPGFSRKDEVWSIHPSRLSSERVCNCSHIFFQPFLNHSAGLAAGHSSQYWKPQNVLGSSAQPTTHIACWNCFLMTPVLPPLTSHPNSNMLWTSSEMGLYYHYWSNDIMEKRRSAVTLSHDKFIILGG